MFQNTLPPLRSPSQLTFLFKPTSWACDVTENPYTKKH